MLTVEFNSKNLSRDAELKLINIKYKNEPKCNLNFHSMKSSRFIVERLSL